MPKASSFSPLRLFTPIQLVFCFILFFLPWIEVQCVVPAAELKKVPKEELEKTRKETGWDPNKPFSMYSQSGLQIAIGDVSPGSDLRRYLDKLKKEMGGGGGGGKVEWDSDTSGGKKKNEGGKAPLLFLYPVAVIAGIIIGFILGPGTARRITLACVCLGALGVIGLQAAIGFPIERELKKEADKNKGAGGGLGFGGFGGFGGGGNAPAAGGKTDTKSEPKFDDWFRVSWQIPLYLTILLLLGATATSFLDGGAPTKARRKAYNFDDDEDEEEDERPRKKKKRVVEDDDDEDEEEDEPPPKKKPKKKALSLDDEEEEERPKKKRPRAEVDEDNEEEERPRKKKKRRDDDD